MQDSRYRCAHNGYSKTYPVANAPRHCTLYLLRRSNPSQRTSLEIWRWRRIASDYGPGSRQSRGPSWKRRITDSLVKSMRALLRRGEQTSLWTLALTDRSWKCHPHGHDPPEDVDRGIYSVCRDNNKQRWRYCLGKWNEQLIHKCLSDWDEV